MKDTLGGQGVQALLNRLKDREEKRNRQRQMERLQKMEGRWKIMIRR